jgi:peptidoglycan/LPS O-acetylase OafA/YrhL
MLKPYPSRLVPKQMQTPRLGHRADLEALRGLAILLVVAYHAGVPVLAGGFVGVDVFFVLSGYFTARLLVQEYGTTGSVDLLAFYGKRALRLLPALLVVVAATLAAVWMIWAPIDRADVADTARAVLSGRANNAFARDAVNYFGGARSPFLHAWSLAVELQVALFGPLLFVALTALGAWQTAPLEGERERRLSALVRGVILGLIAVGALSFGIAIMWTTTSPSWAFFGAFARVWEFVAGALLALSLPAGSTETAETGDARGRGWWLQAVGLTVIVVAALRYDRFTPYPGTAALLPVLGAALVIAGGIHGRGVLGADNPAVRTLGWFGQISYSWYLWHWPMVVTGAVLMPTIGPWGRLALSAAALGPAWLTQRWVERPLRERRGESMTRVPWLPVTAVAGCVAMTLGAGAMHGAAERRVARADQRAFAAARVDRMQHGCWDAAVAIAATRCVFGDPNGTVTVALFGDSHAEHWLAALDRLGRERGWRVVLLVKGGCPVADAPELIGVRSDRRGRECAQYREDAVRRLIALHPDVAVLSSYDEYVTRDAESADDRAADGRVSPVAWGRGLRRTYARLAGAGVPVVAIRGTPYPGFDVPACLSRRAAGLLMADACEYDRNEALHGAARDVQWSVVRDVAARGLPVAAIDLADEVCAAARCGVVRDGRVAFTDGNHLAASFTRAAAGALGARLDEALAPMGVRLP